MAGRATELDRARKLLRVLISFSGLSRREVQRRLLEQGGGTDLSRLLSGKLDLKLRHILDILSVIEVAPIEFFQMLFAPVQRSSPIVDMLDATLTPGRRLPSPPPSRTGTGSEDGDRDDARQRMAHVMRELEDLLDALPRKRGG
jgi:hypothetical protein